MTSGTISGGGNYFALYKINSAHDTVTTPAELIGQLNVKPDIGDSQITLDQIDAGSNVYDFANEFASSVAEAASSTEAESVTLDDGTAKTAEVSSTASSAQQFIGIIVGATKSGNIKTVIFCCKVNSSTGSHSQEYAKFERPSIVLDLVDAVADITFSTAASILPAAFDAAATADLLTGKAKAVKYLAAA